MFFLNRISQAFRQVSCDAHDVHDVYDVHVPCCLPSDAESDTTGDTWPLPLGCHEISPTQMLLGVILYWNHVHHCQYVYNIYIYTYT